MEKHPDIYVPLVGEDGNAFSILARVSEALKRGGYRDEVDEFKRQATSKDYNHLLTTVMEWVNTYNSIDEEDSIGGDEWSDDDEELYCELCNRFEDECICGEKDEDICE